MKEFMYVFRSSIENEEAFAKQSPEQMQAELGKWNTWMNGIALQGKLIGGQPLFPSGKVVKGPAKKLIDGPFIEGKDVVGGYLLIRATDMQDAVEISKGCPALTSADGSVEIREIMPVHA
jgi:hypothetical protein